MSTESILIKVEEELKKEFKIKAIQHNKTLKALIVDATKEWIERNEINKK